MTELSPEPCSGTSAGTEGPPTPRLVVRPFAGAMLGTALGLMPVVALGALAALVRPDLAFSEARLGMAIAAFFAASAVCSVPAGTWADRRGPAASARWATALGGLSLLGIALFARSWETLIPWMLVGGAGNALAQSATNGLVAGIFPAARNGLAFGVKQSAGPLAALVAGASVPAIGLVAGWRWSFAAAALIAVPAFVVLSGVSDRQTQARPVRRTSRLRGRRGPLVLIALGGGLSAGAVNCLNAFYVDSAVRVGVSVGLAGTFFALGGLSGTVVRILVGWWSDRARMNRLTMASLMLTAGATGFLGLAFADPALLLPLSILVFGAGWGWNGLVLAAVVDAYPHQPSEATSITQAGIFAGAVVVPTAFGFVVEHDGYAAAWSSAAGSLLLGSILLFVCQRRLPRS